jgi:hypothetical protein
MKCTTLQNVRDALCDLKNHKAPAAHSIPAQLLKYGGNKVINAINNLITIIWGLEQIPDEWKKNLICPIQKNGDKLSCENYRGIALLCTAYKVLTNITHLKIESYAENIRLASEQEDLPQISCLQLYTREMLGEQY